MISETTTRRSSSSRRIIDDDDDNEMKPVALAENVSLTTSNCHDYSVLEKSSVSDMSAPRQEQNAIKTATMDLLIASGEKRVRPDDELNENSGKRPRIDEPLNTQDPMVSQLVQFPRAFNKANQKLTQDNEEILLIIPDYQLLVQAVLIATSIAEQLQLTVCWTADGQYLEFRGMHSTLVTCYQARWAIQVERPVVVPSSDEPVKRTFFIQASTFSSALQSKGARNIGSNDYVLHMLISSTKNKVKLSFRSNKPSANGYFAEEQLKLMEGTETDPVCDDVPYPFRIKLRVSDIRAIFQSFHDSKEYVDCNISLHTNSRGSYAILLTAESLLRKSKHGFVHHGSPGGGDVDVDMGVEGGELLFESAGGSSVADDMELKFVQSFTVAKLYLIVRAMKEQFMFMSLDQHVPLCIRYDLAITSDGFASYIMCFICPMDDRCDDDASSDQNSAPRALAPPLDALDSDELLY